MQARPLVRADLITGIVLVAFGLAVLAESWGMPRFEERRINPWTVPGLVPGMLGVIIAVLGSVLALRSLVAGALRMRTVRTPGEAAEARTSLIQLLLSGALCLAFALGLIGRMPFWLATGIFVFAFIATFEWNSKDSGANRFRKLAIALAIAVVAAFAISYLFEHLFLVRLP
jgi:hypothetical protein